MRALARNPALAADGRRLMGGAVGASVGDVTMSNDLALSLHLGATACGVDPAEFVRRAIAEKAARVGLRALADADIKHCVGGAEVARRSHKPEVVGSNPIPATTFLAWFNADGDLIDLPPHVRCGAKRLGGGARAGP